MTRTCFNRRAAGFLLAIGLVLYSLPVQAESLAMSNSSAFGSGWQPTPLVDNHASSIQPAQPVAPATNPSHEQQLAEALKPVMPFIEAVEGKLLLKPAAGILLSKRLTDIQTVLFGEVKYQDAGELLAKLSELFPQEAAKTREDLMKQVQANMPEPKSVKADKKQAKAPVMAMPAQPMPQQAPQVARQYSPPQAFSNNSSSFGNDWDDDEFFRDSPREDRGSGLMDMGRGLLGLAAVAGSIAGNIYLNKKLGNNNDPWRNDPYYSRYPYNGYNNGWYSNQWGAGPYNTLPPGVYPQGYANYYGNPYLYNQAYLPYRGPTRIITRPYPY